jgi:hypothetical protein
MLVATRKHPWALWVTYTTFPARRRRVATSSANDAEVLATTINGTLRLDMASSGSA